MSASTPSEKNSSTALEPAVGVLPELARLQFYGPHNYKPEDSVGYMMRRIISLVSQDVERQLEPAGLTNAQWMPLLKLYMGQASTVAELARECELDAGSMTRMLDRLEAKDLCRRVRSVDDRRVVNIELTDAGRIAAQEIPKTLCGIQNACLTGFSVDEWQALKGYLRRILLTAQTLQGEPQATEKPEQTEQPEMTSGKSSKNQE